MIWRSASCTRSPCVLDNFISVVTYGTQSSAPIKPGYMHHRRNILPHCLPNLPSPSLPLNLRVASKSCSLPSIGSLPLPTSSPSISYSHLTRPAVSLGSSVSMQSSDPTSRRLVKIPTSSCVAVVVDGCAVCVSTSPDDPRADDPPTIGS
jgi:hypothetical protein